MRITESEDRLPRIRGPRPNTVAAMACTLSGAYHDYSRLPKRLLDELECQDRLLELADNLHALHRRLYGAS